MGSIITADEVAEATQLARSTVYQWATDGRLPSIKMGAAVRFERDAIEAWLRRHMRPEQRARGGVEQDDEHTHIMSVSNA